MTITISSGLRGIYNVLIEMNGRPHRIGIALIAVPDDDPRRVEWVRMPDKKTMVPATRIDITFAGREPEQISRDGRVRI